MNPKVSIIVCVYNDDRIKRCLHSLYNQNYKKPDYEILIIENGTIHKYKKLCEHYGAKYYCVKERNLANARSFGVTNSKGNFILFTDADCIADKNWINEMTSCLKENQFAVVGGSIKRYNPKTIAEIYGKNLARGQKELQNYLPVIDLAYVVLANAGFSKKALIKAGLFDSSLLSGNDVDICWKLALKGYRLGICHSAVIYHENRKNTGSYFKVYFRYATGQIVLFNKYKNQIKSYKKRINKRIIINMYPLILLKNSLITFIKELLKRIIGRKSNIYVPYFGIFEALGIICGVVYGSIKYKKIPIY